MWKNMLYYTIGESSMILSIIIMYLDFIVGSKLVRKIEQLIEGGIRYRARYYKSDYHITIPTLLAIPTPTTWSHYLLHLCSSCSSLPFPNTLIIMFWLKQMAFARRV